MPGSGRGRAGGRIGPCHNRPLVPIYEYRCNNGHTFEVIQRMSDPPVEVCQECGAPVERVFHPVAVHFKGSGFYTTDYGSKAKAKAGAGEGGDSKGGDSTSDSGKKADSGEKSSGSGDKAKARSTE
jgi:putative FmdB family regulatory protein